MVRRLFTPAMANRTLPLVRRIVADMLRHGRELRTLAERGVDPENRQELERLGGRIRELMQEFDQIGCDYKDWSFDMGLVDFPAEIDGKPVFLCWRSDEPCVTWYHDRNGGYLGRLPIPDELLEEEPRPEITGQTSA